MNQQRLQRKIPCVFVAGSALLLLLSLLMASRGGGEPTTFLGAVVATSLPTFVATSTPGYTGYPPAKATYERREELTRVAVMTAYPLATVPPDPVPPSPVYPPATAEPGRRAGAGFIIDDAQAPFAAIAFRSRNLWYEIQDSRRISVFAGGEGSTGDPEQGVLRILIRTPDGLDPLAPAEYYPTPSKAGPVRIVDVVGERLQLQADDGTIFYFDVATRQWVNP